MVVGWKIDIKRLTRRAQPKTKISLSGDGSADYRKKAGALGSGPYRVITNQALFGYDGETRRMMLLAYLPGKSPEAIQDLVHFELLISPEVKEMALPTEHDLMLLRTKCDPEGFFLKRKIVDK